MTSVPASGRRPRVRSDEASGAIGFTAISGWPLREQRSTRRVFSMARSRGPQPRDVRDVAAALPERHRKHPLLRAALFRSRQFDAINVATLVFYGALAAAGYLVVLRCELRLGYSATQAGAALIPESAVFLLVSLFAGAVVARIGIRWPMASGMLLVAGGLGWLAAARSGETYGHAILPGAVLWGLGIGLTVAADGRRLPHRPRPRPARRRRVGRPRPFAGRELRPGDGRDGRAVRGGSRGHRRVRLPLPGRPALPPASPRVHACPAPRVDPARRLERQAT